METEKKRESVSRRGHVDGDYDTKNRNGALYL